MTKWHADHFKWNPFWLLTYYIAIGLFFGLWVYEKQLSTEVQYIIPTNHACRIVTVTHARYINTACLRWLILQLYTALTDWPHGKPLRRYAIGPELDPVVVL